MHIYDLAPLPEMGRNSLKGENMADLMKKLHEETRLKIEENAYVVDLPKHMEIDSTFQIYIRTLVRV